MATGTQPQPGDTQDNQARKVIDELVRAIRAGDPRGGDSKEYIKAQRSFASSGLPTNSDLGRLVAEAGALVRREEITPDNPWNGVDFENFGYPAEEANRLKASLTGIIGSTTGEEEEETQEIEPIIEEEPEEAKKEEIEYAEEEEPKDKEGQASEKRKRTMDKSEPEEAEVIVPPNEDELTRIAREANPYSAWTEKGISDRQKEVRRRAQNLLLQSPAKAIAEKTDQREEEAYLGELDTLKAQNEAKSASQNELQRTKYFAEQENKRIEVEKELRKQMAQKDQELKKQLDRLLIEKKRAQILNDSSSYSRLLEQIRLNREEYAKLNKQHRANTLSIPKREVTSNKTSIAQQLGGYLGGANVGGISRLMADTTTTVTPELVNKVTQRVRDNIGDNNPLKILGLDPKQPYSPYQVKIAYAQTLAALDRSKDSDSLPLLENLQKKIGSYIDSVDVLDDTLNATPEEVNKLTKQYTLANRLESSRENIQAIRRNEYVDTSLRPGELWERFITEKKKGEEEFLKERREKFKAAVGTRAEQVADFAGRKAQEWELGKKAKRVGKALVWAPAAPVVGAYRVGKSAGKWAYKQGRKHKRIGKYIVRPARKTRVFSIKKARAAKRRAKSFWDMVRQLGAEVYERIVEKYIINPIKAVGNGVRTATTLARVAPARMFANVQARVMSGVTGRLIVNTVSAIRGVGATVRAIPSGTGAAVMTALAQYAILGTVSPLAVGAAFITGTGVRLMDRTLASTLPHRIGFLQNLQFKYGHLGASIGPVPQGGSYTLGLTKTHMALKSLNSGFYGFGLGSALGYLIPGIGPVLGGVIGMSAAIGGRYGLEYVGNLARLRFANNYWLTTASKMPFSSALGVAYGIGWMKYQLNELKRMGYDFGEYAKENWWGVQGLLNAVQALSFVGSSVSYGTWLAAAGRPALGIGAGMLIGGGIAILTGLPIGVGFVAGGLIGGGIGLVVGGFFGGPVGAFILSTIGSTIGSLIGSLVDRALGGAENALKALSYLNAIKAIMDFFTALTNNSKNLVFASMAFVLFIVMGGSLAFEGLNLSSSHDSSAEERSSSGNGGSAQNKPDSDIAGEEIVRTTITCTTTKDELTNPQRSILTKITEQNDVYTLETEHNIFTGIVSLGENLEVASTVSKGKIMGYCK